MTGNINRDRRKRPQPFDPREFLPADPFAPSPAAQRAAASNVMATFEAQYQAKRRAN